MADISGKSAIVTGGTQGLGAAIARTFADRDVAGLVICGRNDDKGWPTARAIESATGTSTIFVKADLGSVDACRRSSRRPTQRSAGSTRW